MHRQQHFVLSLLFCSIASIGLSGCSGSTNFPDSVVSQQVQGPAMQGSVFGGHAPIVGSHVYLLQPGTSGPASAATSLLGNNGATSANGYAISTDATDPNVPAGAKYVTTDGNGAFSLTGGYTCTAGQPVYLYSYGGSSPSTQPPTTEKNGSGTLTTADITQIVVTNAVANNSAGTATYAITLSSNEQLSAGESVTIAGLTGNLAVLNGAQTVLASPAPTATTFSVTAGDSYGNYSYFYFVSLADFGNSTYYDSVSNGTYTTAGGPAGNYGGGNGGGAPGYVFTTGGTSNAGTSAFGTAGTAAGDTSSTVPTTNPIVELATLGDCPSNGNFYAGKTALSFVFINEVSTVATAYTFQPFTSEANNNAWDVGTSGTTQALLGISNAASTAAQLFNIQGTSGISTTQDGEGHIANSTTIGGNGTVPQATIDTLANVLAACVDATPGTGGLLSGPCSSLFTTATDNGQTTGTQPTDIATAAINIARYPSGDHSGTVDPTYAADIYNIPTGTVPYAPQLTSAPNDWTLAISYTGGGIVATNGQSPHSIAVDASGDVFVANYSSNSFTELSPVGVPTSTTGLGSTLGHPVSIALDSTSGDVWLANSSTNTVSRCNIAGGACVSTNLGRTGPQDAEIDGSGNVWVSTGTQSALVEVSSGTTPAVTATITNHVSSPNGLSIDAGTTGDIWVADSGENDISDCSAQGFRGTYTCTASGTGGVNAPIDTAVDGAGDVWIANNNGTVSAVTNAGAAVSGSPFTTGATNFSDGIAVDGNGNVWVSNTRAYAVYVLNSGGVINSGTGYKPNSTNEPDGIAVDPSGNVWYNTANTNAIVELVGAAAPTVTPLSYAVTHSLLGAKP